MPAICHGTGVWCLNPRILVLEMRSSRLYSLFDAHDDVFTITLTHVISAGPRRRKTRNDVFTITLTYVISAGPRRRKTRTVSSTAGTSMQVCDLHCIHRGLSTTTTTCPRWKQGAPGVGPGRNPRCGMLPPTTPGLDLRCRHTHKQTGSKQAIKLAIKLAMKQGIEQGFCVFYTTGFHCKHPSAWSSCKQAW